MSAVKQTQKMSQQKVVPQATKDADLFDKGNYTWMVVGLLIMALGFFLMAGGKSPDPTKFNDEEIYSTTRITIAPILIVLGLLVEFYAIMKEPKGE